MLQNPTLSPSRKVTSSPVELVPDMPATLGTDPDYDRARQLHAIVRAKAGPHMEAVIAEADEITRLRGRFSQGQGGNRGANQHGGFEAKSHPVILPAGGGFQAKLQSELGLHPEQARRLEERADYVRRLRLAAAGKRVLYITGTGKAKREETFDPDDQAAKIAQASLDAVLAGDLPPSRAWAGVVGEGKRVAKTGKKERAAVDHFRNCAAAAAKNATSLGHYYDFTAEQRDYLDSTFAELLAAGIIPESWLVMAAKSKGGRR